MRYTKLIVLILAVILCVGLLAGAIIRTNNATPALKHTAKEPSSDVATSLFPLDGVLVFADSYFNIPYHFEKDGNAIEPEVLYTEEDYSLYLLPSGGFDVCRDVEDPAKSSDTKAGHRLYVGYCDPVLNVFECYDSFDSVSIPDTATFVYISSHSPTLP